jgi:hypothetical protein
MDVLG